MEKKKAMKQTLSMTEEQAFVFIEEALDHRSELTTEEAQGFWEDYHQWLSNHCAEDISNVEALETIQRKGIRIDSSHALKRFLETNIRYLFLCIMTANILWMHVLYERSGSSLVLSMKWAMITGMLYGMVSWIKPSGLAFWKHVHD